tara:strand:- start:4100 stop:5188 length:1089 start_codon:yes stop_codon:yes gene_type:complete
MMNRILKRPMFRMGGRSDDGIMSVRRGYQEGDIVTTRADIEKEIFPPNLLGDTTRLLTNVDDAIFNYGIRPLGNLANYIVGTGEGINTIKKRDSKENYVDMILKNRGLNLDGTKGDTIDTSGNDLPPSLRGKKKIKIEDSDGKTQELSDNDLKTMYEDLLPLFKSELSADEDELKRQKYLELAKFGANLLGQPGGDLIGSVGRAAVPSIEGLTRVAESKRKQDAAAKSLALEAALKQADPGTIMKQVRDIMRLDPDISQKDALAKVLSTGSATRESTKEGRIDTYASGLYEDDIVGSKTAGRKAAEAIEESGLGLGSFQKDPGEGKREPGGYYILKDGRIGKYKGKTKDGKEDFAEPGDEDF